MRIVNSPDEFVEAFLGAQREAAASFGINTILLEKYITQPRHIEVQVLHPADCNSLSYLYLTIASKFVIGNVHNLF